MQSLDRAQGWIPGFWEDMGLGSQGPCVPEEDEGWDLRFLREQGFGGWIPVF